MMKGKPAASPDAYVAALDGWQRPFVEALRAAINTGAPFEERIKWHNLVFFANGPCILIRAEAHRVLLGFWRGKRLAPLDARLKPSGKYELANITFTEGAAIEPDQVHRLAKAAAALNVELGDPTAIG